MKKRLLGILMAVMFIVGGCGKGEIEVPQQTPVEGNELKEPEAKEPEKPEEKIVTIYYVAEGTEDIMTKDVSIKDELSVGILEALKEAGVLSDTCQVKDVSVDEAQKKLDVDMDKGFGDYIRTMGTSGSELVLQCVVKSYASAYECNQVKITEEGNALDTGHTVLDGYISYE